MKKEEITCFNCKKKRHYLNKCTEELPGTPEKKGTNLLINKEDSSDDELASDEESTSKTSDEHQPDKNYTALDDDKVSDDESYEEDDMFSERITSDLHLYKV